MFGHAHFVNSWTFSFPFPFLFSFPILQNSFCSVVPFEVPNLMDDIIEFQWGEDYATYTLFLILRRRKILRSKHDRIFSYFLVPELFRRPLLSQFSLSFRLPIFPKSTHLTLQYLNAHYNAAWKKVSERWAMWASRIGFVHYQANVLIVLPFRRVMRC